MPSSAEKPILIATASIDQLTYQPVQSYLEDKGYPTILYRTDRVLTGQDKFYMDITSSGELAVRYNGLPMGPSDIGAAWYRKVEAFSLPGRDIAAQLYLNNEIRQLHNAVWAVYPDELWINAPSRIQQADRKLGQLLLAQELGFSIPATSIGNDWSHIEDELLSDHDEIVVKMIRGVVSEKDTLKALFTTRLDRPKFEKLRQSSVAFPGVYQPYLDKLREWRVTVVGEDVFPAAIYTAEDAKDDWRKLQVTPSVTFAHEKFPNEVADQCINFLGRLGLKFGAFDFVESHEGELFFLECNTNGQYGWLEEALDLPISVAIARTLIDIREGNDS